MDSSLFEHINKLSVRSVALLICDDIKVNLDINNDKIHVFIVDKDFKSGRYNNNPSEDIQTYGDETSKSLLNWMMKRVFGWVLQSKHPESHFHIDLLYVEDKINQDIYDFLVKFIHVAGSICSNNKDILFGNLKQIQNTWYMTFTPDPPYDIPFARISISDKKWLYEQVASLSKGSVYVEIGSYRGGSSAVAAAANPDAHIICVDTWLGDKKEGTHTSQDHFVRHTQYFQNIIPVQVDIANLDQGPELISKQLGMDIKEKGIDILFIDADHSYESCLNDIKIYAKYIKTGICCFHDAYFGGVKRAINAYFGHPHERLLAKTIAGRWFITNKGNYVCEGLKNNSIWAIKR